MIYKVVKEYKGIINYNAGASSHYKEFRIIRDEQLKRLLGSGERIRAFLVNDCELGELQIQEVLDNGIIKIYSYETHKKITVFAPPPERIYFLYESIGKIPPENLAAKSEENFRKGYNELCKI